MRKYIHHRMMSQLVRLGISNYRKIDIHSWALIALGIAVILLAVAQIINTLK